MSTNSPVDVLAVMDREMVRRAVDRAQLAPELAPQMVPMMRETIRECKEARAAVAELVRRSKEMLEQDQCRFATYNTAPHMATAVDNLRAALAKFGGE